MSNHRLNIPQQQSRCFWCGKETEPDWQGSLTCIPCQSHFLDLWMFGLDYRDEIWEERCKRDNR